MTSEAQQKQSHKVAEVITVLNMARRMELTAVHQYMTHHYDLDDMDYGPLAAKIRKIAIAEMHHAEWFAERIKELGGTPATELDQSIEKNQEIEKIFPYNKQLETTTLERYNTFIKICSDCNDYVSKELFQKIIVEEQEHWNDFDDINEHIKKLGHDYLARMAGGNAD